MGILEDLEAGLPVNVKGSARLPYELKLLGGVYSCSCPAWRNAGGALDTRTCKHLRTIRGHAVEEARIGKAIATPAPKATNTPPLLLANTFEDENVNPAQYLLSEKLDGVRAYWDGKNFVSRLGNVYNAPDWFKEGLPANHPLDGELWMDRGKFQETVAIVRQQIPGEGWRKLRYAVFDAPGLEKTPFRYRLEWLSARILPAITPYAFVVPHTGCDGMTHLMNALHAVEKLGGEGLMLRDPESFYEVGRSSSLLKVKSSKDAEAVVIGYEPGKGKYAGQIGSLEVRDANGVTFHVGSGLPDDARRHPYPVGTLITYRYTGLTDNGLPRFPIFLGLCIDKQAPTALQTPEELEHG